MGLRVKIPKADLVFVSDILRKQIDPKDYLQKYVYGINVKWILEFSDSDTVPLYSEVKQGKVLGYNKSTFFLELPDGTRVNSESIISAEKVAKLEEEQMFGNAKSRYVGYIGSYSKNKQVIDNKRQDFIKEQQRKKKLKKGIYHPTTVRKIEAQYDKDPFEE